VTGESKGLVRNYDYATLAYDAVTGRRQWVKRYNGPSNGDDYSESIAVSPEGTSVFITGRSDFSNTTGDYETIAYDASTGAKRWATRYNGPFNSRDYATSIAASPRREPGLRDRIKSRVGELRRLHNHRLSSVEGVRRTGASRYC
jgi:outer membrane protein assembly factor BamB